jgi:hypothetical protein
MGAWGAAHLPPSCHAGAHARAHTHVRSECVVGDVWGCYAWAGADFSTELGAEMVATHPRYPELVSKYGAPVSAAVDAGSGSLAASVVKVTLRSMAGCT